MGFGLSKPWLTVDRLLVLLLPYKGGYRCVTCREKVKG